jgi:hypothetical protein
MVQDRITDSTRIAQFLASELTGLETGVLAELTVSDVDDDAEPSPEGTQAYRIDHGEESVACVVLYPERVTLQRPDETDWEVPGNVAKITVEGATLHLERVAGVKQAIDALRETVD